jgi:hypothetical protein
VHCINGIQEEERREARRAPAHENRGKSDLHKGRCDWAVVPLAFTGFMKFKAVLGAPQQLSKLIQTLDKLADTCVVHLTPDLLRFGVLSEGRDSLNLHVSCDVSQACAAADAAAPPPGHVRAAPTMPPPLPAPVCVPAEDGVPRLHGAEQGGEQPYLLLRQDRELVACAAFLLLLQLGARAAQAH